MGFAVVISLEPPPESDFLIQSVKVIGEPDKPPKEEIFQHPKVKGKLDRCHIQAWSILYRSVIQMMQGARLRLVAERVFGLSEYQATNVSAALIKEFMEQRLTEQFKRMQKNVENYYMGPMGDNRSHGGSMGSAYAALDDLYRRWEQRLINDQDYAREAEKQQVILFRHAYDESKFDNNSERALSRGEYVARWYQMYFGGEPDSTRYAKFLIEKREDVIDHLIEHGN